MPHSKYRSSATVFFFSGQEVIMSSCYTMAEAQLLFQCLLPSEILISTSVVFSASCRLRRGGCSTSLFIVCYEAEGAFGSADQKRVRECINEHDFSIETQSIY